MNGMKLLRRCAFTIAHTNGTTSIKSGQCTEACLYVNNVFFVYNCIHEKAIKPSCI